MELSPAYDTNGGWTGFLKFQHLLNPIMLAEISAIAAADMVYDFLSILALGVEHRNDGVSGTKTLKDEL